MREADTRAHAVIADALAKGHLESSEPYFVMGLPTHDAANQARLSVGRGLVHHNFARASWVVDADQQPCNPLKAPCRDPKGPHGVAFAIYAKSAARRHVYQQSGGDPQKLKYNPFAKRNTGGYDDDGNARGV